MSALPNPGAPVATPLNSFPIPDMVVPGNKPDLTVAPTPDAGTDAAGIASEQGSLETLSQALNVDLTGFSSPDDARKAAQLIVERYAAAGMQAPPSFQPTIPQPSLSPVDDDEELEPDPITTFDNITDPKVVKKIRALEKRVQEAEARSVREQQAYAQQQVAVQQAQITEIQRRADLAIDKLAAAKYGVGNQQTFSQQVSRQNLKRLADSIISGMNNYGQQVPLIEKIIEMAAFYDSGGILPKSVAPAPGTTGSTDALFNSVQKQLQSNPQVQPQPKKATDEKGAYMNDATFLAGARSILSRGR